jgi:hypothetical protein
MYIECYNIELYRFQKRSVYEESHRPLLLPFAFYAFATRWEPLLRLPSFFFGRQYAPFVGTFNLGFDFGKRGKVYVGLTSCGGGTVEILPQGVWQGLA